MPSTPKLDVTGRPVDLRRVDLDTFFRPRTIAVVGASDTPQRPNTAMYRKIRAWGEAAGATVYPVNPNRDDIDGVRCARSILDVPDDVDLAAILVGDVVPALEQAIEKKATFAVVFAAGFAEVGGEGERLQARVEQLIAESDIHVLGPNTNLNAFETFRDDLPAPKIALVTQSGHQGRPIFQAQELGIALSHWAPTGNEADLELADFAAWFADQPEVGVVAAYVEGFKDGRTLALAADRAVQRGVPIVCVKVGRTDEGRSMAKAHTGHLTGSDAVTSAVFRQYGVTRVDGLDELLDTAAMLARAKPPRADRRRRGGVADGVAVYAISGGTGAHMADMAAHAGLRLPQLTRETQDRLHEWIPPYLRVSNPVDSGGPPATDWRGRKIVDAILADPNVDLLICPITGALPSMSNRLARDLVEAAATTDKPVCVVWGSPIGDEEAYRDILLRSQLPVFRTFGNCVQAVKAYFDYHSFRTRYRSPFAKVPTRPSRAAASARPLLSPGRALSEHRSKAVLSAYGIPVTRDVLCDSAAQAARAAAAFDGAPVVMKVSSPDLLHKSDAGLVEVGVVGAKAVRATYTSLLERADAADRHASIEGVLVCEHVPPGVETVCGIAQDDLFGPTVMFGMGGIFLEVLRDVTFRVPPFTVDDARQMLGEVRGAPLLGGVRGRPAVDRAALVDVIMKMQRMAMDLAGEIAEVDVNPLVALPDGVVALDALVVSQ